MADKSTTTEEESQENFRAERYDKIARTCAPGVFVIHVAHEDMDRTISALRARGGVRDLILAEEWADIRNLNSRNRDHG